MSSKLTFLPILFLIASTLFSGPPPEECYIQIEIRDRTELVQLSKSVSIDNVSGNQVFAYTSTHRLETLEKDGYSFKRLPHPGKNPGVRMGMFDRSGTRAWDAYPTYAEYTQMMQDFATNYPNICQLINIGPSTNTTRPHDLWVLKITDNPGVEEEEPEVLYTSTMHGDETAGFVTLLHFIDELLTHYDPLSAVPYDIELTEMIDNMEIWINPLANPDGTYFGSDTSVGSAIRSFTNTSGANSFVDPNRNFPDPKDGPHPDGGTYWAETQAMMDFADQNHFILSANFHGGAEVANYPWDNWARRHADDSWFIQICQEYAAQAQNGGPSGYFDDQRGNYLIVGDGVTNGHDWYIVAGGRQDFSNFWHGCREITLELSTQKNPPASSLLTYWDANRIALIQYLQQARKGILGLVTTSNGGTPLDATIEIIGHDTDEDQSIVYTDPAIGDYYRMLLPGSYTIRASAYGFIDQEFANIVVPSSGTIRQDFILQEAATINVTGTVLSAPSGIPVALATVELLNTPLNPVVTNAQGEYSFTGVLEGTYTFKVTATNHEPLEEERQVTSSNNQQNFNLPSITIFYFEDFESDDGGAIGSGSWDWGTPVGGPSPHSGTKLWATDLLNDYNNNEDSYLQMADILVPILNGKLKFWHWYEFEGISTLYDGGRLEVSTDGTNYTPLTPQEGYTGSIVGLGNTPGYGSSSSTWTQAIFDLAAYAGQTITIRWHFGSDSTSTRLGWYIDDLQITGLENQIDPIFKNGFENGTNGWSQTVNP